MQIHLGDQQKRIKVSRSHLRRVVRAAFRPPPAGPVGREDAGGGGNPGYDEISLVLVDDQTMRRLNATYRSKDRVTDVLAFDLRGGPTAGAELPRTGEVIISTDRVLRQAVTYAVTPAAELARLVIHGCLHLQGFDHQRPATRKVMRSAEARILGDMRGWLEELVRQVVDDVHDREQAG